ncbi:MAG: citryl-CoA lyase [Planctomycetota bacterium]|jgi:citrate synthase
MSKAAKDKTWATAITEIEPNRVAVRGYDVADLMGRMSFGPVVYLILRGELPDERVGRLMDAILVSSIDHGVTPPSALAARSVTSTGGALSAAVAAGIMNINRYHGGAIEDCAHQLNHIVRHREETGRELDVVAEAMLEEMKEAGARMSGFGHRIHTDDPRAARLFELAREAGVDGPHMEAALAVEQVFRAAGKSLPINVDGAIAAVLADLGFEPSVMNGVFMIARAPGLVAHAAEERARERPMRRINAADHQYDGPPPRSVSSD